MVSCLFFRLYYNLVIHACRLVYIMFNFQRALLIIHAYESHIIVYYLFQKTLSVINDENWT